MSNPNCDGGRCKSATGEVRLLPTGGGGNLILCAFCFAYEIRWRRERNVILSADLAFDTPTWESAEVYGDQIMPAVNGANTDWLALAADQLREHAKGGA